MTPERWKRIGQLYDEAMIHKTDERLAFLRQACGDEEDLGRDSVTPCRERRGVPLLKGDKERRLAYDSGVHSFVPPLLPLSKI